MKGIKVLDACTIINLLRIDYDNYLSDLLLCDESINIPEIVFAEIRNNIKKNALDEATKKRIEKVLPSFICKINQEERIPQDLDPEYYEELLQFTKHDKQDHIRKDNGELFSTVLSLLLSRKNKTKVVFYTDDFPAKKQFSLYFEYQQIGFIEDSVDLLLSLYWLQADFKLPSLQEYLSRLIGEYNKDLLNFGKDIELIINSLSLKEQKDRGLYDNLHKIRHGFYQNREEMMKGIDFFQLNPKYSKVNEIISKYDLKTCDLIDKINKVLQYLSNNIIYDKKLC